MFRVMIVDDEMWLRKGLIASFSWEQYGFCIGAEASNGLEALEFINKELFHLLLVDIKMPYMDGLELMRKLNLRGCEIPLVIAVTGYDDFHFARQCIRLGAFDYILKPVETDELLEVMLQAKNALISSGYHEIQEPENLRIHENLPEVIQEAKKYIMSHFERDISLTKVAEHVDMNPNYLSSLFRQETGYTFINYLTLLRLTKAKALLKNTNKSITQIAQQVGYLDSKHFYKVFKKWENKTPLEFRESEPTEK